MTDSIAARFDRFDPDWLEWVDARNQLARRARRAGRTIEEQQNYEVSQLRPPDPERRPRAAGSYFDRRDPWPIRSGYMIDDPINDGRF